MAFSPNEFASNLYKTGTSRSCNFYVEIQQPLGINDQAVKSGRKALDEAMNLQMRVDSCDVPGKSIRVLDSYTYGPPGKVGSQASFADINMSVILSEDHRERVFFERWFDMIAGNHRTANSPEDIKTMFDIGYLNDYKSTVKVIQCVGHTKKGLQDLTSWVPFGSALKELFNNGSTSTNEGDVIQFQTIELIDAFPTMILPMQNNWQTDEIQRLQVTFTYRYYKAFNYASSGHPTEINRGWWLNRSGLGGALGTILGKTIGSKPALGKGGLIAGALPTVAGAVLSSRIAN